METLVVLAILAGVIGAPLIVIYVCYYGPVRVEREHRNQARHEYKNAGRTKAVARGGQAQ